MHRFVWVDTKQETDCYSFSVSLDPMGAFGRDARYLQFSPDDA